MQDIENCLQTIDMVEGIRETKRIKSRKNIDMGAATATQVTYVGNSYEANEMNATNTQSGNFIRSITGGR